jgi:DNA-binding winged helix-turn-helix (wHTH) protein
MRSTRHLSAFHTVEARTVSAFRIGDWLVEPTLNSLSKPDSTVRLEPKVMQVLVCLAEHAGKVISKDRLFQSAWPGTFVTDDVLTRAISELRRALGDDPKHPRFIQTIPKGGYRLVADVTPVSNPATNAIETTSDQRSSATALVRSRDRTASADAAPDLGGREVRAGEPQDCPPGGCAHRNDRCRGCGELGVAHAAPAGRHWLPPVDPVRSGNVPRPAPHAFPGSRHRRHPCLLHPEWTIVG